MKLIKPKVEIIPQEEKLLGVYKQIEIAGRTCYKSENNITSTSAESFVNKMIKNGHTAMLEHGTVYLKFPNIPTSDTPEMSILCSNPYTKWKLIDDGNARYCTLVTTNLRVLVENKLFEWAKTYICEPTEDHIKRVTVRFITDRGVSHELVRHRVFSFAQESSRYCNYSKSRFEGELTFILPTWSNIKEGHIYFLTDENISDFIETYDLNSSDATFIKSLNIAEKHYMYLLSENNPSRLTPQQARQILPNALKTEVIMTGFVSDWRHFFDLRCAPNAHPDMQVLANQLKEQFIQNKYI